MKLLSRRTDSFVEMRIKNNIADPELAMAILSLYAAFQSIFLWLIGQIPNIDLLIILTILISFSLFAYSSSRKKIKSFPILKIYKDKNCISVNNKLINFDEKSKLVLHYSINRFYSFRWGDNETSYMWRLVLENGKDHSIYSLKRKNNKWIRQVMDIFERETDMQIVYIKSFDHAGKSDAKQVFRGSERAILNTPSPQY